MRVKEYSVRQVERPCAGLLLVIVSYIVLCLLYFMPVQVPHKIALPLLLLSAVSLWRLPWLMCLAMISSCLGDLLGSMHSFEGQMLSFGIAHICMVIYFSWRYAGSSGIMSSPVLPFSGRAACSGRTVGTCNGGNADGPSLMPQPRCFLTPYNIIVTLLVLCLVVFSFVKVIPAAPQGFLRYGVSGYCIVISAMLLTALLQRDAVIAAGAVLFVCSDMVLGWNRFVSPVDGASYMIMVPYYLGQFLIFIGTSSFRRRR